jgi:hypothetical protein
MSSSTRSTTPQRRSQRVRSTMSTAVTSTSSSKKSVQNGFKPEFSVLLPVYNERENLPLVIAMLDRVFTDK